jgi:hypothetical protein
MPCGAFSRCTAARGPSTHRELSRAKALGSLRMTGLRYYRERGNQTLKVEFLFLRRMEEMPCGAFSSAHCKGSFDSPRAFASESSRLAQDDRAEVLPRKGKSDTQG